MRRRIRIFSSFMLIVLAATVIAAGAAVAAPNLATSHASMIAAHGLGAERPTQRIAPRVVLLDVTPASVDLRQWAVAPGNQGQVGSCVTWAIDYGMLGWYSRYSGRTGQPFAPMYTYSQINGGVDRGSSPIMALQVALNQGSDTRADYTQGDFDWEDKPTAAEHANAAKFKISGYETLFSGNNQAGSATLVKYALATKHPVAIEMAVRNGFDSLGAGPTAVDNDFSSAVRGYHEVLAVGYDRAGLIIENSWGTGWANGGFGRVSWQVVLHDVWEADTIDGFAPAPPPPPTPPTVSPPTVVVASTGAGRGDGTPPATPSASYKVTWKGTVGTSGAITRYEAWYQIDGGALKAVTLASATATTFTLSAHFGHHYRIAVRARTRTTAGAVRYGTPFLPAHS